MYLFGASIFPLVPKELLFSHRLSPLRTLEQSYLRTPIETRFHPIRKRFTWKIRQRMEDRREIAVLAIGVLHNIFSVRGVG